MTSLLENNWQCGF